MTGPGIKRPDPEYYWQASITVYVLHWMWIPVCELMNMLTFESFFKGMLPNDGNIMNCMP